MRHIILRLHETDNVAVVLETLPPGTTITEHSFTTRETIPQGHKMALVDIPPDAPVIKYGQTIGFASQPIAAGDPVHVHNIGVKDFGRDYAYGADCRPADATHRDPANPAIFAGIVRPDGRIATRNYIGILSTVSCAASVSRYIAGEATGLLLPRFSKVDGVVALTHGSGCCMTPDGDGFNYLQRVMAGYARHPNLGGVLLVGLGCETNLCDGLIANMQLQTGPLLKTVNIQTAGGARAAVAKGLQAVSEMLPLVNQIKRTPVPVDQLILGLECGGSDAYSGITANPALGAAADLLVQHGGTAVLSETPEIYGAEHLLTRRAVTPAVGQKLVERIRWWEAYTARHGATMDNNPTPGNKAGGLSTILEKSLGAISKGGTSNLTDVVGYAEPVTAKGLVFMDTPGYDVVSITGMIAGGAHLIAFTSGRGTVCGFKPVPTVKLASNSTMFQHMAGDMDVDCGGIVDGTSTVQQTGRQIFDLLVAVAGGHQTSSELIGLGDFEFVPWQMGAVM